MAPLGLPWNGAAPAGSQLVGLFGAIFHSHCLSSPDLRITVHVLLKPALEKLSITLLVYEMSAIVR